MTTLALAGRTRVELEEVLRVVETHERALVKRRAVPNAEGLLLRRAAPLIQAGIGLVIAWGVALLGMVLTFAVANVILHYGA